MMHFNVPVQSVVIDDGLGTSTSRTRQVGAALCVRPDRGLTRAVLEHWRWEILGMELHDDIWTIDCRRQLEQYRCQVPSRYLNWRRDPQTYLTFGRVAVGPDGHWLFGGEVCVHAPSLERIPRLRDDHPALVS